MLEIIVPKTEYYNSIKQEFGYYREQKLRLEHSLISISKWESIWRKPFLVEEPVKTTEEIISYIECMLITPNVDKTVLDRLSNENFEAINDYIASPMTATWFNDNRKKNSAKKDIITSEVIYAQMIGLGIPIELEKWHINRLLTLIRVCDIMFNTDSSKNKMSQREIYKSNKEINEARRKKMHTKG